MATEVIVQTHQIHAETAEHDFSWLERFALKCFHPWAIFIEVVGFIWSIYYLWNYNWQMSLGVFVLALAVALLFVMDTSPQKLSETTIGKIGLLHLHPMNLATIARTHAWRYVCHILWSHVRLGESRFQIC